MGSMSSLTDLLSLRASKYVGASSGPQGPTGPQGVAGPQGSAGATGTTGATNISWRGQYSNITSYANNDAVGYNGSTYFCIYANTGGHLPTDTIYWQPLSMLGSPGIQGPAGLQGPRGAQGTVGANGAKGDTGSGIVKPTNYIYVAKNGNDTTGDGSAGSPYLTISKAITVATAGITVFIFPGTYTENLTLKVGVNLTCPVQYGVYVIGNHTATGTGTIICDNIVFQNASSAASGTTLTVSGSTAINLQFYGSYINSFSLSGAGDAIQWTNTNASSKIQIIDGNVSVAHSNETARCFYSTTGAAGSIIANRVSFKLDNPNNVALAIGGAVSFTHTADAVLGQAVVSNSASYTSGINTHTTASVPTVVTNSTGTTTMLNCVQIGTSIPMVSGAGVFTEAAVLYPASGKGTASTLNGGQGAYIINMSSVKLRSGTLKPVVQDGLLEYDGTHLYFTIGTTRYTVTLTA